MQFDEPNFRVPLASSYNPRSVQGATNTITNALDQRKVNSMYEPVQNAMNGNTTLYLTKRPGLAQTSATYGSSGQVAYLVSLGAGLFGVGENQHWVFSTSGNDIRASSSTTTTTILTAAGYYPAFVDKTAISGTDTIVVQLVNASTGDHRVFYSSAIGTFTEITDSDFAAIAHTGKMEFMDGYAFAADQTNGRIHNSDLNSLSSWSATGYITKQIIQDSLRGLARLGKMILAFGVQTVEVFVNAGNQTGSPLKSIPDLAANIGLGLFAQATGFTHGQAVLNGKLYFLGREGLQAYGLYVFDGAKFAKLDQGPVSKIISEQAVNNTIYSVSAVRFSGKDAIALQFTNTTASTQIWLMYFPAWNEWFEWRSDVFTPVNNGRFYLGVGSNQHVLYEIDQNTDIWTDVGGNTYQFVHQFQLPKKGQQRKFMRWFGVEGDTARSALNLAVEFSDDDGQTWSTARNIDMTSQKKMIYRCGSYRDGRMVRLSYTGSLEVRLQSAIARID